MSDAPSRRPRWIRTTLVLVSVPLVLIMLCVGLAESWTAILSHGRCHDEPSACRSNAVGLVLGCSKYVSRGRSNYFYATRMQAAANLWHSGKVRGIIVSGDNRAMNYNEPRDMKNSLIQLGVPADRIVCDFAGICTYDSVARANQIFGANQLIIVSQEGHAERAVAIARHLDIEAEGLNAEDSALNRRARLRAWLRERGARVSMLYDFITDRTPHHLGNPESLPF